MAVAFLSAYLMGRRKLSVGTRREEGDSRGQSSHAMCSRRMALRPRRSARRGESRQPGDILQGEGEGEEEGERRGEGEGLRQQLQARVSGSLISRGVNAADRWVARPAGQLTTEEQARLERQRANKRRWARKERERCRKELETLKQSNDTLQTRNTRLRREVEALQKYKCKLRTRLIDHTCRIPIHTTAKIQLLVMPQLQHSTPRMNGMGGGEGTSLALSSGPQCTSCLGSLETRKERPLHSLSRRGQKLTPASTSGWKRVDHSCVANKRDKLANESRGAPSGTPSGLNISALLESSVKVWSAVKLNPQQIAMEGVEAESQSARGQLPVGGKGRSPHRGLQPVSPQQLSETGGRVTEQMSQSQLPCLPDSHPSSLIELRVTDDDAAPTVLQADIPSTYTDLNHPCGMPYDPCFVDTSLLEAESPLNGDRDSRLSDFSLCDITIDAEDLENLLQCYTSGTVADSKENSRSTSDIVSHGASATVTCEQSLVEIHEETLTLAAPMDGLLPPDTQTPTTSTQANILDTSPSSTLTEKGFLTLSSHCREDSVWSPAVRGAAAPSSHPKPQPLKRCMSCTDSPVSPERSTHRGRHPSLPTLLSRSIMEDLTFSEDDDASFDLIVSGTDPPLLLEGLWAASPDQVVKI